ncbi:hypothetical protein F0562_006364 [Nyssa sinensis]|uniref:BHLH domain-containing protein n=1 Tax=Nyssa sinensis TaxID=561372 RepID=A0A5J5ANV7_9ASTE|nr:hypothetical protein F0562_006364 [Nyssa sinensis]
MDSANLYQLHQQFVGLCSLATQSGYAVSTIHDWNPSIILNGKAYDTYMNEILPNSSRDIWPKNANQTPSVKTSTIQDISFCDARSFTDQSAETRQPAGKIKEVMSHCFPKFSDMTGSLSNIEESQLHSTSCINRDQLHVFDLGLTSCSNYNFSHIPTTEMSNVDMSSSLALDLLTSTNNGGISCNQSSHDNFAVIKERMSLGHNHSRDKSSNSSNKWTELFPLVLKTSGFRDEVTTTKRVLSTFSGPKATPEAAKKPRFMSQSSCQPFKVRKEKLGDRIAALHRLVAPFGKTDTASVLTEAIGYIQFLQEQIQTLSVPYMKSYCSKPCRTVQMNSNMEDQKEALKQDLRSRGLCLVPLSFTSYISASNGSI